MNHAKHAATALVAAAIFATGCAGNASFKNRYASQDFEMAYLETDEKTADRLVERVGGEFKAFDVQYAKLADLTKPLPGPVADQVKTRLADVKNTIEGGIKGKVMAACASDAAGLTKFLAAHNVFKAADHPYGYNLIDRLAGDDADTAEANKLIDETNAVLKDAYKVQASIALAKKLVELSKADVADLKAAPAAGKAAGLGLISVSVTRNTVTSLSQAQGLLPRVQAVLTKTTDALKAKPMLAMKIGGVPGQLGGVAASLAGVAKDGPELLGGAAALAQEVVKL